MHPMNESELDLQFLQLIRVNGNMYHLLMSGWTHTDIIKTLSRLAKQGIVKVKDSGTSMTAKGNHYFNNLCKTLGKKGISRYLSPDNQQRIQPMPKETIYIPFRASEEF